MMLLHVEHVTAGYGGDPVLNDVSIHLDETETVVIIGPNGAGKSTLLKCIAGLVPLTSGSIRIGDVDLTNLSPELRPRYRISYVAQSSNVFSSLSVRENLEVVMPRFTPRRHFERRIEVVSTLFPELLGLLSKEAVLLSGGQRQIVAVSAALMRDPRLILMDEPSAGLSPDLVRRMLQHIQHISEIGVAVLLVEQNARESLRISDRGYVLESGRNVITGTASELLNDKRTIDVYVGSQR